MKDSRVLEVLRTTERRGARRPSPGAGFIVSVELMLVATVLTIGLLVGLQAVRASVVTELADLGGAIGNSSQTYSHSGVAGHHGSTNGSLWQDSGDSCEFVQSQLGVQGGVNSVCVAICEIAGGLSDASAENAAPLPANPFP